MNAPADNNDDVDEDENLFELQIKNLDTNEVFKIPIAPTDEIDQNYASKRKHEQKHHSIGSSPILFPAS